MMRRLGFIAATILAFLSTESVAAPEEEAAFRAVPPEKLVSVLPVQVQGSISDEDYPPEALSARQSGTTVVKYIVSTNGRVTVCEILGSSGADVLDQKSCELVKARFQFVPAKDKKGKALASIRSQRITWRMPDSPSPLADMKPVDVDIELIVAPDGTVKSCRVLKFESSFHESPNAACPWATRNGKFKPFEGTKDRRLRYHNSLEISDVE